MRETIARALQVKEGEVEVCVYFATEAQAKSDKTAAGKLVVSYGNNDGNGMAALEVWAGSRRMEDNSRDMSTDEINDPIMALTWPPHTGQ
jgi:hypothetical protein